MVTRRTLLKGTAFGALSTAALSRRLQAAVEGAMRQGDGNHRDPHFFVFVQMQGAWDPCLAFEPKDRSRLLPDGERAFDQPYSMEEVHTFGSVPLAPAGRVLGKYSDRLAVITGLDMEVDVGHNADLIMSGALMPRSVSAPYIQAVLSKRQPFLRRCSIPHVYSSYDGNFYAGPYGAGSVVATSADLTAMLGVGATQVADDLARLERLLQSYREQLPGPAERRVFAPYLAAVPAAMHLVTNLNDGTFRPPADGSSAAGMAELFGQLFARGITGAVTWQLGGGTRLEFDTHSAHYAKHGLGKALEEVDLMMSGLSKIPLDEHTVVSERTTVVLTSEFSRTPRLNDAAGKDHNIHANALVLLGHKVRPGVFGASGTRADGRSYLAHAALPIDFATGRPQASGRLLKAANLWAGFGKLAGVDLTREFGVETPAVEFLG